MLSHRIMIVADHVPYWPRQQGDQCVIKSQKDLNDYYEQRPWLREGNYTTFSTDKINSIYQVNYIAKCERDYDVLIKNNMQGYQYLRCVYILGCHFIDRKNVYANGQDMGPNWARWEAGNDARSLTEEERKVWVNDQLQNRLNEWIEKTLKPLD